MKNDALEKASPRSFPLGALFLLLTVSGMLAGLAAVGVRDDSKNVVNGIVVGLASMVVGAIFGILRTGRLKGALVGGLTCLVAGGFAGTVLVLRTSLMLEAALICISASVLLIVAALIFARRG